MPSQVLNLLGREVLAMRRTERERWTLRAMRYWRRQGFPFSSLSPTETATEFARVAGTPASSVLHRGIVHSLPAGLRLANAFHPQMWSARLHDHLRSPLDYFSDDGVLYGTLRRTPGFWPNRRCWNAQCIRSAFRIYGGGRVANFRPTAARALIAKFSGDSATVLDFSAGYGGRLLGALTLPRYYLGVDPEPAQHSGLQTMLRRLEHLAHGAAELHCERAEVFVSRLPSRSVDLIIWSPPYFKHETYSKHPEQSAVRYSTYAQWREEFLKHVLGESRRVLKRGGHIIVNAKDTRDHPVASDTKAYLDQRFTPVAHLRLALRARPLLAESGGSVFKSEPIFVYRNASGAR